MTQYESDELDGMLRDLLGKRPTPTAPTDLARLAMRRARAPIAPGRFRRASFVLNAIAAAWIILLAGQQLYAHASGGGFDSWLTYERETQVAKSTSTTVTTTDHTAVWLLGGGVTALFATAGLLVQRTAGDADELWNVLPV